MNVEFVAHILSYAFYAVTDSISNIRAYYSPSRSCLQILCICIPTISWVPVADIRLDPCSIVAPGGYSPILRSQSHFCHVIIAANIHLVYQVQISSRGWEMRSKSPSQLIVVGENRIIKNGDAGLWNL
jgi:hypothetical protein